MDRQAKLIVITELGSVIDDMHYEAHQLQEGGHPADSLRQAADFLSEVRKELQREGS